MLVVIGESAQDQKTLHYSGCEASTLEWSELRVDSRSFPCKWLFCPLLHLFAFEKLK